MATTRQSIIRGPGAVTFGGVTFHDASGIVAEIDSAGCDCEQLNPIADIGGIRGLVPNCSPDPQFAGTPPT